MELGSNTGGIDRRRWLFGSVAGLLTPCLGRAFAGTQDVAQKESGALQLQDADPDDVERKLRAAGVEEPRRLRSNHYLAIGDAAESFMRSCLTDCELLLLEYLRHFRDRGFEVREPERSLIVVAFRDDRSFGRYHGMPSLMNGGAQPVGMYDKVANVLSVFDWRNVPMATRAANRNVQTLSHEGTHQLTFNTGLLDRSADVPLAVIEGLGTYGEPRKVMGPSDLGRVNLQRADDLAKLRRSVPWIPVRELISNDETLRAGLFGKVLLAYAESWALVHYLLHDKDRLPGFHAYVNLLHSRSKAERRLADAQEHLGDLEELDRDLQAYVVRVIRSL